MALNTSTGIFMQPDRYYVFCMGETLRPWWDMDTDMRESAIAEAQSQIDWHNYTLAFVMHQGAVIYTAAGDIRPR